MLNIVALSSIPFAFTEFLFYPSYWEPKFLWNLVNLIGFGIEDIIFVIGLSAFSSSSFAVTFQKKLTPCSKGILNSNQILISIFILYLITIFLFIKFKIHLIFGAPILMLGSGIFMILRRSDLLFPGIFGGLITMTVYSLLCFALLQIYPSIFELTWHTEKFLNTKIFHIPLEELIYAFSSGFIATLFYPYVFSFRYISF
ncbi:MAG: lycopene cyclase domain-containing protein [Leptospira sp.]|nr:lycopene cyclase domain-containing protein [Leptospira sp.]